MFDDLDVGSPGGNDGGNDGSDNHVGVPSAEEVTDALIDLHGLMCAAQREMLAVIAAASGLGDGLWLDDGATSLEAWVTGQTGASFATAVGWVRNAGALERLPELADVFAQGRVSADQLRHLVTMALRAEESAQAAHTIGQWALLDSASEPPTTLDAQLCRIGQRYSDRQLSRMCALLTPPPDPEPNLEKQSLRVGTDARTGWTYGKFRLYGDVGVDVANAIAKGAEAIGPEPDGTWAPLELRNAWALHTLVARPDKPSRAWSPNTLVVHADADLLFGGDGTAEITRGPTLAEAAVRRIACDCWLTMIADGPDGRPLGDGRAKRLATGRTRDHVRIRDGGCRFGRCANLFTKIHHIDEWVAKLGRTDVCRLCELCTRHHTFVHEHGWTITGDADGELVFTSPTGRRVTSRPRAPRPAVTQFFANLFDPPPDGPPESEPDGPPDP